MAELREIAPKGEPREVRIKRLKIRSMRRGTKEMDLILIRYSDARLEGMSEAELDHYDRLLSENDQDLYKWVSGAEAAPERVADLVEDIAREVGAR